MNELVQNLLKVISVLLLLTFCCCLTELPPKLSSALPSNHQHVTTLVPAKSHNTAFIIYDDKHWKKEVHVCVGKAVCMCVFQNNCVRMSHSTETAVSPLSSQFLALASCVTPSN